MCGWGLVAAIIIVLSKLAGVAVTFFHLFLAELVGDPETSDNVFAALADPVLGGALGLLLSSRCSPARRPASRPRSSPPRARSSR